jgi:hypothetical protein
MSDFEKISRDKAKSQGFAALGIPIGSVLIFKKDPAITVKTLDDKNKVEYLGKPYSISTLAKQLVGSPVSGYWYFKVEGKVLKNLVKGEVKPVTPKPVAVPDPVPSGNTAETPDVAEEPESVGESGQDIDPLAGETEAAETAESANVEEGIGA